MGFDKLSPNVHPEPVEGPHLDWWHSIIAAYYVLAYVNTPILAVRVRNALIGEC
jgi:hypothetical protein